VQLEGYLIYIWERHILRRLTTRFILMLLAIFILIMGLDFSLRAAAKQALSEQLYLSLLRTTLHSGLIVSVSLLLASHSLFFSLLRQGEWLTLLIAGTSVRRIARPFIWLACGASMLVAISLQWLTPLARATTHTGNGWSSATITSNQFVVCRRDHDSYAKVWWIGPDFIAYACRVIDGSAVEPAFVICHDPATQEWTYSKNKTAAIDWAQLSQITTWHKGDAWQGSPLTTCLSASITSSIAALYVIYAIIKICMPMLLLLIFMPYWGRYRRSHSNMRHLALALTWMIGSLILLDMAVALGALRLFPAQQCISAVLLLYWGAALYNWRRWHPEQHPPPSLKEIFQIGTNRTGYKAGIEQHSNPQAPHQNI